jgi:outer membrane protein assembly factor BamB
MRLSRSIVLLTACAFLSLLVPRAAAPANGAAPEPRGNSRYIGIGEFRFDPLIATPSLPPSLRHDVGTYGDPVYHIVQFRDRISPGMMGELRAAGAVRLYYVNDDAYVVRADRQAIGRVRQLSSVRWVGTFEPAYKLSPLLVREYDETVNRDLESHGVKDMRVDTTLRVPVVIMAMEESQADDVARAARTLGGSGVEHPTKRGVWLRADMPRDSLEALARVPGVAWIDRDTPTYAFNDIARWTIQSYDSDGFATPVHDHGVTGTGQTVTIGDSGLDYRHNAFEEDDPGTPEIDTRAPGPQHRKVTAYYTPAGATGDTHDNGPTCHGTHVSGTVAGDDAALGEYDGDPTGSGGTVGAHDGQAYGAKIQMQDISTQDPAVFPGPDMHPLYQEARDHDSWIHTNSWGSCCGGYGARSQQTDDFVFNNPNFVVLFAAGNDGPALGTVNPNATGKNMITVGAAANGTNAENFAFGDNRFFSSRGPVSTADPRLKPDVMAPGENIWSAGGCDPTQPGCEIDHYKLLSGTSMATPTTAGAAALVRQYYMDGYYPSGTPQPLDERTPSAALVKATLINGAVEMTGPSAYENNEQRYPSFNQGWGRILLDNALFFQGDNRDLAIDDHTDGIAFNQTISYPFAVRDGSMPLEITLVWSDAPPLPNATQALVNDLDLTVRAPDGTVYRGNQYSGSDPGQSVPGATGVDRLNNVESVLVISNVQPGLWTVEVFGYRINTDSPTTPGTEARQPYALVMTGARASKFASLRLDKGRYLSSQTVNILLADTDLNVNPAGIDSVAIQVSSTTETLAETVTLNETGPNTSALSGSIPLHLSGSPIGGDQRLQVRSGDTITASYFDADDGLGGSGLRTATAVVDDDPPLISGVAATEVKFSRATIVWTTNEPADTVLRYGTAAPPTTQVSDADLVTSHSVRLTGLQPGTTYFFEVQSADVLGNTRVDNSQSYYYQFTTPPLPPTPPADPEWPTYHNGMERQGVSPSFFLPPLAPRWSVAQGSGGFFTGPVLKDGILYSVTVGGIVHARDPFDGDLLWERALGQPGFGSSNITLHDGRLFITVQASKGVLYALDPLTGDTDWALDQPTDPSFRALGAIAASGGRIFTTSTGGDVIALNAADGTIAWTYHEDNNFFEGVALGAGLVFANSFDARVLAINASDGTLDWSQTLGQNGGSVPLYAGGKLFVGTGRVDTQTGRLFALDAGSGAILWQVSNLGQVSHSTPAFDGAALYFGTTNHQGTARNSYLAVDASDGEILWEIPLGIRAQSAVAYADGYVYGTAADGYLRVIDALTGQVVESHLLDPYGSFSHPAISGGWVWAEGGDGTLHAFQGADDPDDDNDGDPDTSDCAPLDPAIHHGAFEVCNGKDDDCDGAVDEGFDVDGDGFTTCGGDCNDLEWQIHPGGTEVCNTFDDDCDGLIDEGMDADGDGYTPCQFPGTDCNDSNPAVHPGATEACNAIDDDCDFQIDEDFDGDHDGWTQCSAACASITFCDCADADPRINGMENTFAYSSCFDRLDNDCDGVVDWDCAIDVSTESITTGTVSPAQPGGLNNMKAVSPDDTYETLTEATLGGVKRLTVFWTFLNPSLGNWWDLRVEGNRSASNGDQFTFSFAQLKQGESCATLPASRYAACLTVTKTTDDDRLQFCQLGPPAFDTIAFCVKAVDSITSGDSSAQSLRLDKIYLMPILLDSKATNEILPVAEGTRVSGTYVSTQLVGSGQETLREGPPTNRLRHTWVFDNVPVGFTHQLYFQATRPDNSEKENFQFYWAPPLADGTPGTFTSISGAVVSTPTPPGAVTSGTFGPAGLVGKVFIQVRDTKASGGLLDSVSIDYLAIRATP